MHAGAESDGGCEKSAGALSSDCIHQAMVYAYELGKKYTTERLMEKWKEVIRFVG